MSETPAITEEKVASAATESSLRGTISRLRAEGHLSDEDAARLERDLPETMRQSAYVLRHLTAHWTIGAVFAFDLVPLPLGTMARVCWVLGSRVVETLCGRWDHGRVHSLTVLGLSAIPVAGYFAYLVPLRSRSADAVFLYANHFTYSRSNCSLPAYLERRPKWIARIVRGVVRPPVGQAVPDESRPPSPISEKKSGTA